MSAPAGPFAGHGQEKQFLSSLKSLTAAQRGIRWDRMRSVFDEAMSVGPVTLPSCLQKNCRSALFVQNHP